MVILQVDAFEKSVWAPVVVLCAVVKKALMFFVDY